jgi:hypothetical protein
MAALAPGVGAAGHVAIPPTPTPAAEQADAAVATDTAALMQELPAATGTAHRCINIVPPAHCAHFASS